MLSYPVVIGGSLAIVLLISVVVYAITGSALSILVIFGLAGILGYVLYQFGYIKVNTESEGIDIQFFETEPSPASKSAIPIIAQTASSLEAKEVFYISGNNYTYDESKAVCAAYEADLASYDQVMQAYNSGAEWCGYGWTQGGMALYPTQEATWKTLQTEIDVTKRTACGRPGLNGGYFDPNTKFGVNCFGVKPKDPGNGALAVPGEDDTEFNNAVNMFRSMIDSMVVYPFNKTYWSQSNIVPTK